MGRAAEVPAQCQPDKTRSHFSSFSFSSKLSTVKNHWISTVKTAFGSKEIAVMFTRTLFVARMPWERDCTSGMMDRVTATVTRAGSDTERDVIRSSHQLSVLEKIRSSGWTCLQKNVTKPHLNS